MPSHSVVSHLTWVGIHSFLQGSSRPRNWTQVSCIAGRVFTAWITMETLFEVYFSILENLVPWVHSLGRGGPLEKRIITHSSILAWRTLWTEEPGDLQSMRSQTGGYNWVTNTFTLHFALSILENTGTETSSFPSSLLFISSRLFQDQLCLDLWFHFLLHCAACKVIVPWPAIKPMPPALEGQSLNLWTAREVLFDFTLYFAFATTF